MWVAKGAEQSVETQKYVLQAECMLQVCQTSTQAALAVIIDACIHLILLRCMGCALQQKPDLKLGDEHFQVMIAHAIAKGSNHARKLGSLFL